MQDAFKAFFGPVLGGGVAIILAYLAYRRSIRPVLVFHYKQKEGWFLQNVGSGPAIRVIVANADNDKKWKLPTLYSSIPKDGRVQLLEVGIAHYLAVKYTDINNGWYSRVIHPAFSKSWLIVRARILLFSHSLSIVPAATASISPWVLKIIQSLYGSRLRQCCFGWLI